MYNDNYQDEFMLTSSVFEKCFLGIQDLLHVHKTYTYTHAIESSHNPLLPGKDIAILQMINISNCMSYNYTNLVIQFSLTLLKNTSAFHPSRHTLLIFTHQISDVDIFPKCNIYIYIQRERERVFFIYNIAKQLFSKYYVHYHCSCTGNLMHTSRLLF